MVAAVIVSTIIHNMISLKFLTKLFYGLIGIASSLAFVLILYWALRLDSAITNIVTNTYNIPLYFWPYVILTLGTIVFFGINISMFVYRFRKFGSPKITTQGWTGVGSLVSVAASACPVCGSTILSAIGIAGGLAVFPFQGLELKALSFTLMALPVWLMKKDLTKLECGDENCPAPRDYSFKEADRPWLILLIVVVVVLALVIWNMLKTEPIIARALTQIPTWSLSNG